MPRPVLARRTLLQASAAAALGMAAPALAGGAAEARALPALDWERHLHLPSVGENWRRLRMLSRITPLETASSRHRWYIDWLERRFRDSGLTTHRRTYTMPQRWQRTGAPGLVLDGRRLHVSGFQPWSGQTGSAGVTGRLWYAGTQPALDYSGAAGKVVVVDVPRGVLDWQQRYRLDGAYRPEDAADFPLVEKDSHWDFLTSPKLAAAKAAGAVAVVVVLSDISDAQAEDQQPDFLSPPSGIPAIVVGRSVGARLRAAATGAGGTATVRLPAVLQRDVPSDNLWAVLPGRTDRVTVVNSHSDGCNALEENGGIALVAMARHFASLQRRDREHTLVFLVATGHFGHGQIEGNVSFASDETDIIERTQATVTVEHLGSMDWQDDASGHYRPTGQPTWATVFSQRDAAVQRDLLEQASARRIAAFSPNADAAPFGLSAPFYRAGIPVIGWIAGPSYTFTAPRGGELDKLSPALFQRQLETLTRCVHAVDGRTRAELLA